MYITLTASVLLCSKQNICDVKIHCLVIMIIIMSPIWFQWHNDRRLH